MICTTLRNCLVTALTLFFAISATWAQDEAPANISLSLEEAKQYALDHNLTIQNASIDIRKAEAAKWQALSSMLPQVSASVDYSTNFGYKMNLGQMSIALPPSATMGVTTAVALSAAQVIGVGLSDLSKQMSDITLRQTEQQITNNVKTLYYSALVTQTTITLLEKSVKAMEELYTYTLKSVEVGAAEQTSADQLRVQQAQMETSVNSTKRALEMVYNSLRVLLNISAHTEIELSDTVEDLLNEESAMALLGEEFNLDDNYSYQLLEKSTELAAKQVDVAKWAYAPSIRVFHQYNAKYYFSDEMTMNMTPPNMLGVSVSVPIFSSGNRLSAVKSAKYDYNKQLNTLENTGASLEVQYRQLCYNLVSAYENFQNQKDNLEVTQRVFDNISRKYQYGMASSMEVTTSSTDLVGVQNSYVQSLLELVNAQIALEELMNK